MTGAYVQGHKLMCECINSGTHNDIDLRFMLCVPGMFLILLNIIRILFILYSCGNAYDLLHIQG